MGRLVILLAIYFRNKLGNTLLPLNKSAALTFTVSHLRLAPSLSCRPTPFLSLESLSLSPWSSTRNTSAMSFFSSHHHRLWRKDFGKRGTHLAKQGIWGKITIFLTKLSKISHGVYARVSLLGLCKKFLFGMKSLVWSWVMLL